MRKQDLINDVPRFDLVVSNLFSHDDGYFSNLSTPATSPDFIPEVLFKGFPTTLSCFDSDCVFLPKEESVYVLKCIDLGDTGDEVKQNLELIKNFALFTSDLIPPSYSISKQIADFILDNVSNSDLKQFLEKNIVSNEVIVFQKYFSKLPYSGTFDFNQYNLKKLQLLTMLLFHLDGRCDNFGYNPENSSIILIDAKDILPRQKLLGKDKQFLIQNYDGKQGLYFSYLSELTLLKQFHSSFDVNDGINAWLDDFLEQFNQCLSESDDSFHKYVQNIVNQRAAKIKEFLEKPNLGKDIQALDHYLCPFKKDVMSLLKIFELDKREDMFFNYMNSGIQGVLNYVIERSSFASHQENHIDAIGVFIEKLCINLGCYDEEMVGNIANYLSEIAENSGVLNEQTSQLFVRIYQKIT